MHIRRSISQPRALLVADSPHWVYHRKARNLQKRFKRLHADIGFVSPVEKQNHWMVLRKKHHYDVIWFMGYRMGHDAVNSKTSALARYVKSRNRRGCAVVATVTNSLIHFNTPSAKEIRQNNGHVPTISQAERRLLRSVYDQDVSVEHKEKAAVDLKRISQFNAISANNKFSFHKLNAQGIHCNYVPDGVDLETFQYKTPLEEREFGILFISSRSKQHHKGIKIFRALKRSLADSGVKCRSIVVDSSSNKRTHEKMCQIYNQYPIFICASQAEGGPATLLESTACGCIPISTPVGYSQTIIGKKNGYIVPRDHESFLKTILDLRDRTDLMQRMSLGARKSVKNWSWDSQATGYEQFLISSLR